VYIFLSDEELLYFIVRVEVAEIQIWFEFKLVYSLQKGLKIYKGFSIFLRCIRPNSRSQPSRPPPACGPIGLASQRRWPSQPSGRTPVSRIPIRPVKRESDPITPNPTR
jgi:hypothetical protein